MKKLGITLLLIGALLSTDFLLAQGPGSSGPPAPPGGGSVDDVSITTFLWILALAGAYLGFKKAK